MMAEEHLAPWQLRRRRPLSSGGDLTPVVAHRDGCAVRSGKRNRPSDAPSADPSRVRARDHLIRQMLTRLKEWGVVEKVKGKLTISREDTLLDVWHRYFAREDVEIRGNPFFKTYRSIRSMLEVTDLVHPDWVLQGYVAVYGEQGVRKYRVMQVLGRNGAVDDAYARLCDMVGRTVKQHPTRGEGTLDDLLALLPEDTREAFRGHLSRELYPPIQPIQPNHVWRVKNLRGAPLGVLAALAVIESTGNRRTSNNTSTLIRSAEVHSRLVGGIDQQDGDAVSAALLAHLRSTAGKKGETTATVAVRDWARLQRAAVSLAELVLKEDAPKVLALLPACRGFYGELDEAFKERQRKMTRKARRPQPEKVEDVAWMVSHLIDIQAATENRVFQLEQMLKALGAKLRSARRALEHGLETGFEWQGPVVRPDGSLGEGEQTVHFRLVPESLLTERAAARRDDPGLLRYYPDDGGPRTGERHDPERWQRLHVVYDRTEPAEPGGEWHEPDFVQFFRWGVFEGDSRLTDEVSRERLRLLAELNLPQWVAPTEGLLGHSDARRAVAIAARGADPATGDIVIPLLDLYHALAYARIALRFGIRWGARLSETMQLRIGCAKTHVRDGARKPYVELKPKGWDVMGKFGMDPGTAKAIRSVRALSNARWHGRRLTETGEPWLPDVNCGQRTRDDLADAAYIFQNGRRALRPEELTAFIKVLLHGVVDFRSHDGRRIFATALGLDGSGYDEIGVLLHHSPGSAMPARYDLSALIVSDDAAERHNAAADAREIGATVDA